MIPSMQRSGRQAAIARAALLAFVLMLGVDSGTQQLLLGAIGRHGGPLKAAGLNISVAAMVLALPVAYQTIRAASSTGVIANLMIAAVLAVGGGGYLLAFGGGLPWYAYAPGLLGLILVAGLAFAVPRLGTSAALTGAVAGQTAISLVWDQLGLFGLARVPIDAVRIVGAILLVVGVVLILRRETR